MGYETIDFQVEDKVALVTMNRPGTGNAINRKMHEELNDAWLRVNRDDDIWVAVVSGANNDFSTGDDLDELGVALAAGNRPDRWTSEIKWQERYRGLGMVSGLPSPTQGLPGKPLIAAVHGRCYDSAITIAVHSDFVIGDETAEFGFPQVQAGLAPLEDVVVLARLISRPVSTRLALLGGHETLSAQRAYELGLIIELAPDALEKAMDYAHKLNDYSAPLAVRGSKAAIFSTYNLPYDKAQLMSHVFLNQVRFHSDDAREGPRAFAEKRKPNWQAR